MTKPPVPLYGLLLSGGASRRMQQDKAAILYGGEPQLVRAWRLLRAVTEQAFISVRADQLNDALRADLPQLVDSYDAIGPVAGILSAQDRYPHAAWLVLACDLPLLDAATLQQLINARDACADATAFTSRYNGLPEPLCAIWEPASHGLLKQRQASGSYCPRKALMQLHTVLLPAPGDKLDNANTPEEQKAIQQRMETI